MLIWVFTAAAVLCLVYYGIIVVYAGFGTSFAVLWLLIAGFFGTTAAGIHFYQKYPERVPLWLPVSFVTLCASGLMILLVTQILIFGRIPATAEPSLDYVIVLGAKVKPDGTLSKTLKLRLDKALEYAKDSGVLFKSGIMEALHQLGLCDAVYGKLYSYLFGWEPRGVVLHQVKYPSVQEVIATAKAAGAVLVFAHPTVYKSMPLVRQLAKEGIIDGIEVEHPRNSPEDRAECAALCEQYGLIHTGGTDFHGANHKVPHPVGTCTTADDQVARILELAHKRRGIDV